MVFHFQRSNCGFNVKQRKGGEGVNQLREKTNRVTALVRASNGEKWNDGRKDEQKERGVVAS